MQLNVNPENILKQHKSNLRDKKEGQTTEIILKSCYAEQFSKTSMFAIHFNLFKFAHFSTPFCIYCFIQIFLQCIM